MKKAIVLLMLLVAPAVYASQTIELSPISFQINSENALSKVEQTFLYPDNWLNRFKPVGAKISNKHISQNVISFNATKNLLFISKSVYVNGILEMHEDKDSCPKNNVGYSLKINFESSDDLVANNVEELQATICLHSQSNAKLEGFVRSKIITGKSYSKTLGPIAINLITKQEVPLINALTEEIKSLR